MSDDNMQGGVLPEDTQSEESTEGDAPAEEAMSEDEEGAAGLDGQPLE